MTVAPTVSSSSPLLHLLQTSRDVFLKHSPQEVLTGPSEDELQVMESAIHGFIDGLHIVHPELTDAGSVISAFFDAVYNDEFESLTPSLTREEMNALVDDVRKQHPAEWELAAEQFGLQP